MVRRVLPIITEMYPVRFRHLHHALLKNVGLLNLTRTLHIFPFQVNEVFKLAAHLLQVAHSGLPDFHAPLAFPSPFAFRLIGSSLVTMS